MFTAYYLSALMDDSVIGVIDGVPVLVPFENKPFYYKTGYLLIIADPEVPRETLFPQSFRLPEKPNVPRYTLFPQRSFKIPDGNVVELPDGAHCLTSDIQALEWFGRLQTALSDAHDFAKGNYLEYCRFIANRLGVPYVTLEQTVAPRKLAPGAMTPEQVQEVVGF